MSDEYNLTPFEAKLKETRTIEANKKGYIGMSGKFATIIKAFGEPVLDDSFFYRNNTPYEDFDSKPDLIPTIDSDDRVIFWHWDSLKYGRNICIKLNSEADEIMVTNDGIKVYSEESGEISSYIPDESWEGFLENVYQKARKSLESIRQSQKEKRLEEIQVVKKSFIQKLISKWGKI